MADVRGRRPVALASGQTVGDLVDRIAHRLSAFGDPKREARELVAALLDVPRHWPLLKENKWLEWDVWQRALAAAGRRARGAPLAYAVRKASFRRFTLTVDERVLIPRPETELLVDLVLSRCTPGGVAVDVGTGSGAIALALEGEGEGKFDRVIGTDISLDAIAVARENARNLGAARAEFRHGNLLMPAQDAAPFSAIVSNPPYISYSEIAELPRAVRDWEPALALLSAGDGLAVTARLVRQASALLEPGGLLALEVDARRASLVAELVASEPALEDVTVKLDLAGRERFVLASRRTEREGVT